MIPNSLNCTPRSPNFLPNSPILPQTHSISPSAHPNLPQLHLILPQAYPNLPQPRTIFTRAHPKLSLTQPISPQTRPILPQYHSFSPEAHLNLPRPYPILPQSHPFQPRTNPTLERIEQDYVIHLLADNLPSATKFVIDNEISHLHGFKLGFKLNDKYYINNHLDINIKYNKLASTSQMEVFRIGKC